jgi:hypothetical protein
VLAYQPRASSTSLTDALIAGLLLLGVVFAVNSSLHFRPMLAFSKRGQVTMGVSFYYISNVAVRLLGTLLSAFSYQLFGLPDCPAWPSRQ